MSNSFTPLISAAGFGELVGLIFVMVSVIGYIIKNVQGNNQQLPPPVQRPGKRRDERVAEDLDTFLQQVNRQGQAQPQPDQQQRQNQGQSGRGNNRQRSQGGGQSSGGQRGQGKPAQRQQNQPPRRLVDDTAARREAAGLGNPKVETVAQHVREHMGERIAKEAQRDVGQDIKASVLHNMGTGLLAPAQTGTGADTRTTVTQLFSQDKAAATECCAASRMASLRKLLSNPESVRQAIVIQEILNRPKCLR